MIYSYNWLRELSGSKKTATEMADKITMHSFEVEEIEKKTEDFAGVVVGEILKISKHPNAEKLQLIKVDVGKETLNIVCGAKNIAVGDKVPVALVGAVLPGNFQIKEAEIRGEKSFGMLCAMDELGLGSDHSGIFLLDKKIKIGTPLSEVLAEKDESLEIKILPDRAHDAMSHVGMAREIAALEGKKIDYDYDGLILPKQKTQRLSVEIKDSTICTRYIGAIMTNIEIRESPLWMKQRLETCGIRPINNVVDVTNFVMLEIGQPLHAFDFEEISKKNRAEITIRKAKKSEKIILLDETEKILSGDDIVIVNEKEILALAGVMGGVHSGINKNTKTIVLEAATFDAASVRKSRTSLNMVTEAALRFEKEIDPNLAEKAMVRAVELLTNIAGGKLEGLVDEYPVKRKKVELELEVEKISKLLGLEVPVRESKRILESLDFEVVEKKNVLNVTIPTFRLDIVSQENLIEEIGRVYGYDKIKASAPLAHVAAAPINQKRMFARKVRDTLVAQGFSEVYNYSFYSKRDAGLAELANVKHLELEDPGNPEQELLRVSLIPNLLKNIRHNLKNFKELFIFEVGRVFWPNGEILPEERNMLVGAIVLDGSMGKEKNIKQAPNFFEAKGHCDTLLAQLGISDQYYDNFDQDGFEMLQTFWHQGRSAEIKIEGNQKSIGFVGEVSPLILTNFDIHTRVALFEFDLENLSEVASAEREFRPLRKYPVVLRDVALLTKGGVLVDEILQVIQRAGGDLVLEVDLFDMFDFADGSTSFAFHIAFGADERTLTSEEVDGVLAKILKLLESELQVAPRK